MNKKEMQNAATPWPDVKIVRGASPDYEKSPSKSPATDAPAVMTNANHENENPFSVSAGKLEGDGERNYKYVNDFPSLSLAIAAAETCKGYHFIDIEYESPDGKRYLVEVSLFKE